MEKVERSTAESVRAFSEIASLRAEVSALRSEQAKALQSLSAIAGAIEKLQASGRR